MGCEVAVMQRLPSRKADRDLRAQLGPTLLLSLTERSAMVCLATDGRRPGGAGGGALGRFRAVQQGQERPQPRVPAQVAQVQDRHRPVRRAPHQRQRHQVRSMTRTPAALCGAGCMLLIVTPSHMLTPCGACMQGAEEHLQLWEEERRRVRGPPEEALWLRCGRCRCCAAHLLSIYLRLSSC